MKKQVFTLLMMLVLVALAGKTFAQNTAIAPWESSIHTYVVNGLTLNDGYTFGINQSSTAFSQVAGSPTTYTINSSLSGTAAADGLATLEVQWNVGSAVLNIFYVWIRIEDSEGCYTYRYLPVDPDPAGAYPIEFSVQALLVGDDITSAGEITGALGATTISDVCPMFVGENWLSTTSGAGSATDGSSYVYFRIQRNSDDMPNVNWEITPSTTFGSASWDISTDNAVSFNTFTMGLISPITTGNTIYLRATVTNTTIAQTIPLSITDGNDVVHTTGTVSYTPASATLTLDPLPAVGSFSGSN